MRVRLRTIGWAFVPGALALALMLRGQDGRHQEAGVLVVFIGTFGTCGPVTQLSHFAACAGEPLRYFPPSYRTSRRSDRIARVTEATSPSSESKASPQAAPGEPPGGEGAPFTFTEFKSELKRLCEDTQQQPEDRAAAAWLLKLSEMDNGEKRVGHLIKAGLKVLNGGKAALLGYEKAAARDAAAVLLQDPANVRALHETMSSEDMAIDKRISRRRLLGNLARLSGVSTLVLITGMAGLKHVANKSLSE